MDRTQLVRAPLHLAADDSQRLELDRLLAEGLLRPAPGGVLIPAQLPDTMALRAGAVRLAATRWDAPGPVGRMATAVIGYRTACWVYAGGAPPELADLVIPPSSARPKGLPLRLHEHRLETADVLEIGPATVTTPLRTAADLARFLPAGEVGPGLTLLQRSCGIQLVEVLAEIERLSPGRFVARARQRVLQWAAVRAG